MEVCWLYLKHELREKSPYSVFSWSILFRIWIEYGKILRISLYSVRRLENTDQKTSAYGHFSRSGVYCNVFLVMINKVISMSSLMSPMFAEYMFFYDDNITMRTKLLIKNTGRINCSTCVTNTTVLNYSHSISLRFI